MSGRGRRGGGGSRGRGRANPPPTPTEASSRDFEQKVTVSCPEPVTLPPPSSMLAVRPGYGSLGVQYRIQANHFLVTCDDITIHHYDVTITPEVTSKTLSRNIMNRLYEIYGEAHLGKRGLAYDGKKSAFASGVLPFASREFVVNLIEKDGATRFGREREFKVSIKFAAKRNMFQLRQFLKGEQCYYQQEVIQALDVVLRAATSIQYVPVGRSLYSPHFGEGQLGDGISFSKGFYQSIRPTQMGLSLNIDMSATSFYPAIPVLEFVKQILGRDLSWPLFNRNHKKLGETLRNVKVEVNHTGYVRRYKISSLSAQPTNRLTFPDDTGAAITVVQYFHKKYKIDLRYTFLPAIQSGTDAKPTYLPMEICNIVQGQKYSQRLNEKQVTALLKATCQRPADRARSIMETARQLNYNSEKLVNVDFGIRVGAQLTSIDARVLPPPQLKYHNTSKQWEVEPFLGQWNMTDKKMYNGGIVDFWTCVNFSKEREEAVKQFCHELGFMCQNKGMVFNSEPLIHIRSTHPSTIEKTLIDIRDRSIAQLVKTGHTGKQLQLLIVILPNASGSYGTIKRVCETELGIISQCCEPKNVPRLNKQYLENLALKINVKVGGRNTVLSASLGAGIPYVTDKRTIIFGADVTHPSRGEDSSPSIAAVVASMDWPQVTKYRALVSAQTCRQEIIEDLYKSHEDPQRGVVHEGMIIEHLKAFSLANGCKPQRIIFYRDGVGEGQFKDVLLTEMHKIRMACQSLQENYLPTITFVVVQKRHHTRLFPARDGDKSTTDRSGNIIPGTVVDTKICHPTEFDFYLCSHASFQGTSRPTHYHVLYDENKFTADALQTLTYSLCYTYARCTRSVSIVPPVCYAHLAAHRARHYVEGYFSKSETAGGRAERNAMRPLPKIKENVKDVMFYC